MKNWELKKLVNEYKFLIKSKKQDKKINRKLVQIKQRYFHETGTELEDAEDNHKFEKACKLQQSW